MPYKVQKSGDKWKIINKNTGKTVGTSDSKAKADASVRARLAGEHNKNWKKRGRK
jgi:hypothetical protein